MKEPGGKSERERAREAGRNTDQKKKRIHEIIIMKEN